MKNLEMKVEINRDEINDIMELKIRKGNKIEVKRAYL
jgi:phosphotransferase system HPr-like phosphotransfer protein